MKTIRFFLISASLLWVPILLQAQCWNLVWADEFSGPNIDQTKWSFQTGASGWGNNELQNYTDRIDNATINSGHLNIIARAETYMGANYTSARMRSIFKGDWTYGRIEGRMKLPEGQGIWPAFWLLPSENVYGIWPFSGEIDIMELLGHEPNKTYGTIHTQGSGGPYSSGANYTLPSGTFSDSFHDHVIEWEPTAIRWYVDGTLISTKTPADLSPYFWPFNQDFHIILNTAVGGNWPGAPDATTSFPQTMEVDYVRVYQLLPDIKVKGLTVVEPTSMGISYSLPNIAGATYTWAVPSGASIASGQGTSTILVNWGNTSGNISVDMTTVCGTESYTLAVEVTTNLWLNPEFENDYSLWDTRTHNGTTANFGIDLLDPQLNSKASCIDVQTIGANIWDIQLSKANFPVIGGEEYLLSFWAKSDVANRSIAAAFINATTFTYQGGTNFTLGTSWTHYTYLFTPTTDMNVTFNIDMGNEVGVNCFDNFDFSRTALLPIELDYFEAQLYRATSVLLNWRTLTETDHLGFDIERSLDGQHFQKIGFVKSASQSLTPQSYQFIDPQPKIGDQYYRLKSLDLEGSFVYSPIQHIRFKGTADFYISPNPTRDILTIHQVSEQSLTIQILDIHGKIISVGDSNPIDVSNLTSGVYILHVVSSKKSFVQKFIKL